MKRLVIIGLVLCMMFTLIGCGHEEPDNGSGEYEISETSVSNMLQFTSVDELVRTHSAIRRGRTSELADLAKGVNFTATYDNNDFTDVLESVNFAELETFHLPTGIPDSYQLLRIDLHEEFVIFWFMPGDDLISISREDRLHWTVQNQSRSLSFSFTRWNLDSPMDGILQQNFATQEDLVNGKYLFHGSNKISWAENRESMLMILPDFNSVSTSHLTPDLAAINSGIVGAEITSMADLIAITETTTIDLTDDTAVAELLEAARR